MASAPNPWQHLWCCSKEADITLMLVSAEPVPTSGPCAKAAATGGIADEGAADQETAGHGCEAVGPAGNSHEATDAGADAGCIAPNDAAVATSAEANCADSCNAAAASQGAAEGDVAAIPAAKRPRLNPESAICSQGISRQAEILHLGPAHKKVLTAVSDFIRARFESCAELDPAEGPWGPTLKLHVPRAEWDYAMDVLRFAYGLQPTATTVPELLQVLLLANEWQLPTCIDACLKNISDMKPQQLSQQNVELLLHPAKHLAGPIWEKHSLFTNIKAACARWLVQQFSCGDFVLSKGTCLQAFKQLSLTALLVWTDQKDLQADSENSVVVMIHQWWLAHADECATASAEWDEQSVAEQLTAAVRLKGLSLSYLSMIESLPWFRPPQHAMQAFRFVQVVHAKLLHLSSSFPTLANSCMPRCWAAGRAYTGNQGLTISWDMFDATFDDLHARAVSGTATTTTTRHFYSGYYWSLMLELASQSSPLKLYLEVASALPNQCLPPALGVSFTFPSKLDARNLRGNVPGYQSLGREHTVASVSWVDGSAVCIGAGKATRRIATPTTFQVDASSVPRANSRPPNPLWFNPHDANARCLKLQVRVGDIQ